MIPLNAFPAYMYGRELRLKFLSRYPSNIIERAIDTFEQRNKQIVRKRDLIEAIRGVLRDEHDLRVANLIYYSLRVFYRMEEPKSFLAFKKKRIAIKDEWDVRIVFYDWVQKNYGGFIPLEEREEAIKKFCDEYGINKEKIDSVLAGGILKGYKLVRRTMQPPTPREVISVSNFLLIEKTLGISNYAIVVFKNIDMKGALMKDLLFRSKRARLLLDFKIDKNKLICYLSGPFQVFKHPSPIYGEGIRYILMGALCRHKTWWLKASVRYRKRNLMFEISSSNPALREIIPPWRYTGDTYSVKPFDSEAEQRLYYMLCRMFPEGKIVRESDIIQTPDGRIFIPDFTVSLDGSKVFIELVGFWTENYAKKKREKLDKVYECGIKNIIALVDKKLAKYFRGAGFTVIPFDREFNIARRLREAIQVITGSRNNLA